MYMLAKLFPLGVEKRVVLWGDKYTGGTLSAATQTRAGSIPAVKRGFYFVYVCDSVFESREEKGIAKERGLAFREKGNYTRAHRR